MSTSHTEITPVYGELFLNSLWIEL
jgi:hypothetical protein